LLQSAHLRWLREELPGLVEQGILDEATAERLRAHYGEVDSARGRRLVVALFGTLGALFVGGGFILLIAHNWDDLGRPARTALSFLPLVLSLALAAWVVASKRGEGWQEAVGGLWTLSIGASISLVAQTYHIPGDLPGFLRLWLLLALPILYVLPTATGGLLYALGLFGWVVSAGRGDGPPLFWALLAAAGPFLAMRLRRQPRTAGSEMLVWAFAATVACGVLPSLERLDDDLRGPLLATTCLALWAGGAIADRERWERPLRLVGGCGLLGTLFVLSYADAWDDHLAPLRHQVEAAMGELVVAILLVAATAALLALAWRRRGAELLPVVAALPVVWLARLLAARSGEAVSATVNLYLLALGAAMLAQGMREERLRRANLGAAVLGLLILLRFFDTDWGFLVRGLAFVAVGLGFLLVNLVMLRRRQAP